DESVASHQLPVGIIGPSADSGAACIEIIVEHWHDYPAFVTQEQACLPVKSLPLGLVEFTPRLQNELVEVRTEETRVVPFGIGQIGDRVDLILRGTPGPVGHGEGLLVPHLAPR